jgi:hypothetical protein
MHEQYDIGVRGRPTRDLRFSWQFRDAVRRAASEPTDPILDNSQGPPTPPMIRTITSQLVNDGVRIKFRESQFADLRQSSLPRHSVLKARAHHSFGDDVSRERAASACCRATPGQFQRNISIALSLLTALLYDIIDTPRPQHGLAFARSAAPLEFELNEALRHL